MKLRIGFGLVAQLALLSGCAIAVGVPLEAKTELVPQGTLRAAINFGNPILATRTADGGVRGVSIDLARALASQLNVALEFVTFESAGHVVCVGARAERGTSRSGDRSGARARHAADQPAT